MFRFKSITARIIFLHVVAVVATALVVPVVLYLFMNSNVKSVHQQALREQADWLGRHLVRGPGDAWTLDLPADFADLFSPAYGRYSYAVLDGTGRAVLSSQQPPAPLFATEAGRADDAFRVIESDGRVVQVASVRKIVDGQSFLVQLGEDPKHPDALLDDVVGDFLQRLGWITIPILLLLLPTDIIIVRRAMRPLIRASTQARGIGPTRIDVRLSTSGMPREIRPLIVAVNQAFGRLEEGFRRQREFAADVAHELRTPLAILRTRIETLSDRNAVRLLHDDIEGMARVVSQLLDSAELEILLIDPSESADLHAVCADMAEFVAPLAVAQGKAIALSGYEGELKVRGNGEMLRRAVRNLLENAIRHTPAGTTVEIVIDRAGIIAVLDEGEGVPAARRDQIFQRFWSRDRRKVGGAGLGLSIVKRIIEAHGGTVTVENRTTGGAAFSIDLAASAMAVDGAAAA